MRNLFEKEAADEVCGRLDKLQPETPRQWGKMDVAQMMAHCSAALDMASGKLSPPAHVHRQSARAPRETDLHQRKTIRQEHSYRKETDHQRSEGFRAGTR